MNRVIYLSVLSGLILSYGSLTLHADPFQRGSHSLSIVVGSGSAFRDDYIILGAGYGYYIARGLELGIDAQFWLSGDPSITKVSPQIKYVFTQPEKVKPYLGAFYRRTYTEGLDDLDSIGYRAGANFMGQGNFYFGAGIVYEDYQDCSETIYSSCSDTYPEILFSFSM
jgi:hypothetical protein